jgi:hypothetical protein
LATASDDGTLQVWAAASDKEVQEWIRQDKVLEGVMARNVLNGLQGCIKTWLVLLPLPFPAGEGGGKALDRQQVQEEAQLRPRLGERVRVGNRDLVWREHRSPQTVLDFNALMGRVLEFQVAYAVCYLESDRARDDVWLEVSSDDQSKIYLNGREIYRFGLLRGVVDLDRVGPIALKQGTNVLVFKVVNEEQDWEGCIRLVDKDGAPARGIRVKLEPEP